ncbi:two-component system response regulator RppA [Lyngbya confervoides]|uniref:Response regulator transcription factor n=1 Tax=Lyngbya confervoides BDU141951 TaxID=1574623 RepID=A0ABD4T3X1_9CYAN|nr:two-component system response regulator RppA [Lyngbya confervoides]MCM1983126.1 response regulator transcription factor [Lyngbya confervoides BDU141951]
MDPSRILIVDDEEDLTHPLKRVLSREGYQVDVATDGEAAIATIEAHRHHHRPYSVIILDWMLPGCSGIEVCRSMRSHQDATPVLFLTAKDTLDDRVQGLDVGADDYLVKPFELRELLARVRALLRRQEQFSRRASSSEDLGSAPSTPNRLRAEGLELDPDNLVVYRKGRTIALSEKECRLLAYLMQHPQTILSHEEIYNHLWPEEEKPGSNVLAAQMRLLRRKIETPKDPTVIHTIYGKGYRFGMD